MNGKKFERFADGLSTLATDDPSTLVRGDCITVGPSRGSGCSNGARPDPSGDSQSGLVYLQCALSPQFAATTAERRKKHGRGYGSSLVWGTAAYLLIMRNPPKGCPARSSA